jgi:8-oxo-dGTP pyrophosphatase MutT (NUDIX family)
VEPDEDPAAAVAREVREELGIEATFQDLIGVYGGPEFRVAYPNGDQVSYVTIVYGYLGLDMPAVLDTREVDEIRFVADLGGLRCARWLPPVHADATRWWRERPASRKR